MSLIDLLGEARETIEVALMLDSAIILGVASGSTFDRFSTLQISPACGGGSVAQEVSCVEVWH